MNRGRLNTAALWLALIAVAVLNWGPGYTARNGSGTYATPNSFSPGTTISSSDMNENFSDIASEITNSVAVDGQSTMTGPLKLQNGSQAAPALTFGSDLDTGCWRKGANNMACGAGNTEAFNWTGTGITLALPVTFGTALDTTAIANSAITYAKIQNVSAQNKLLGRYSSGAGVTEEIGLGTGLTINTGNLTAVAQLPRGYIDGCTISNNGSDATNDIDIAAGVVRDSTNAVDITCPAHTGKQLDANWATGSSAGIRNSGAGIANGTYHIYVVAQAAGASPQYYAHTSTTVATVITALQAETGGSSYIYARRIGSILRESATIVPFTQNGDYFLRKTLTTIISANNPGTSAVTRTLDVPTGIRVRADILASVRNVSSAGVAYSLFTDLDAADDTPSNTLTDTADAANTAASVSSAPVNKTVTTNTSGQIRSRISFSDANVTVRISVRGWLDARGKDN